MVMAMAMVINMAKLPETRTDDRACLDARDRHYIGQPCRRAFFDKPGSFQYIREVHAAFRGKAFPTGGSCF